MRALAILAGIPLVMWLGQTVLLRAAGLPLRWRISAADLPRPFKRIHRAVTYAALVAALGLYPLLRGYSPLEFYAQFFPLDRRPRELLHGGAAAILYLALLYLAWVVTCMFTIFFLEDGERGVPHAAPLLATCGLRDWGWGDY